MIAILRDPDLLFIVALSVFGVGVGVAAFALLVHIVMGLL